MTVATPRHKNYGSPGAHSAKLAETVYVRTRREWDARMGSAVIQARNWRINSLVLAGLLSASMVANVYLGRQPKLVPHVIEVDALGDVTYRGPAGGAAASFTPSEALVRYQLRRWIELTRTVSSDNVLLKKNWIDAYEMLTVAGNTRMTEWVAANDPFERAQSLTTSVEISSAVPITADSWQIDWKETTWDKYGQSVSKPLMWRAMLKVVLQPPETRQQMIDNPLGLFIDEFHWDRVEQVRP